MDPSEAARTSLGAFEVFNMFGEKRMRLSTPSQYPELGGIGAVAGSLSSEDGGPQKKVGKRKKRRTSIIEAAEVGLCCFLLSFVCCLLRLFLFEDAALAHFTYCMPAWFNTDIELV